MAFFKIIRTWYVEADDMHSAQGKARSSPTCDEVHVITLPDEAKNVEEARILYEMRNEKEEE